MKDQKDIQYNGPSVPKRKQKDYTDHISSDHIKISEAASIKMMALSGATKAELSRTFNRSQGAITGVIENFEKYMPDDGSLKQKIEDQMEQITQELCVRSKAIVDKADKIAYERLENDNVSPLELTKISELHMNRFAQIMGENRLKSIKTPSSQNNVQINVYSPTEQNNTEE